MPGERDRLLAQPLHEVAVGGEHIGVVVDGLGPELGRQHALGERHPDRGAKPLAERTGRGLDARRHEAFGMAGRLRFELAEATQLVDRNALDAGEVQEPVEQHRAVAGGQHETVAVGPARIGGVVFQELREQHRGDVGGAHRQPGMAGFRLLDRVHGERPQGVREIRMGDACGGGFGHERFQKGTAGSRPWGRPAKVAGLLAWGSRESIQRPASTGSDCGA